MRHIVVTLVWLAFGISCCCSAKVVQEPSESRCIERLEMPVYPVLARAARLQSVVTARLLVKEKGTVLRIESDAKFTETPQLFKLAAEQAIRASRFRVSCAGKTVVVIFHFELTMKEPTMAFGYPNHFYVRAGSEPVNPSNGKSST